MSRARDGEKAACTWRNLSGRINSMPRNRRIAARSPGRGLGVGMFGALSLASVLAPAMLASVQPASGQASTIQNIGEALRASNYTAALQLIEPALRESPNDPRLWSMQGMALSGLRRAPEALASYKHALKISPDYLPALEGAAQIEYEADNKNAIPLLQQILRARPDDATSHAMLGTMDYKRGNCRDAVLHFDRSQSVLQSQPLALQQYGSCLAKVDRVDEAVAVFQKLVESNPTDAASRRRLAALQLTARRPKDAMATLQPLLLIDPPDPRVAELACAAYEADGNTPEGVSVLNRAVAANPRDIDLYVDLALLALDHHSFASGIEVMTSGLQVLPQAGPLYLERGILYVQLGEYAQAAKHAIELGGFYDGHELPADVHKLTKASVVALAGQGLVAAAKDNYPRDGSTFSYVASFAEVEVDVETGKYYVVDFLASGDVGTVIHPRALGGQMLGRSTLGIGHAIGQKWVFDPHYGEMLSKRFHHSKPPTILDVPVDMQWTALDIPDPETPVGARGVGEPPVAGGCGSILNALSDALGDEIFQRAPVNADTILTSLEAGRPMQHPLMAHI